jgi:hypothetical protein
MAYRWSGPLAPYGVMTGDRRQFTMGRIDARSTPLPLSYQAQSAAGHTGSVVVGSIDSINLASNPIQGSGTWLSPEDEPAVRPAMAKAKMGVIGPSVDLDNFVASIKKHTDGQQFLDIQHGRISGATLVGIPAFADQRLAIHDDNLPTHITAAAWNWEWFEDPTEFGVNPGAWGSLPIAGKHEKFSADIAIKRIADWSNGDAKKFNSAFLWKDPNRPDNDMRAYRLPVGDIIDGKLHVIYHAIYAAAALIQGAHGGLPGIPDADKATLKGVINKMYNAMGRSFGEDLEPPWNQGADNRKVLSIEEEPVTDPIEKEPLEGLVAGGGPLAPPKMAFDKPELPEGTIFPWISPDGRLFTYVAEWDTCHTGVADDCILSPKSKTDYQRFHQGSVKVMEGDIIRTGKLTMGGGHAAPQLGLQPAVDHYDDVCTAFAVVRAGEDERGVYVAGTLLPGVTDDQVATFRRSPLSGDWRYYAPVQNLELVAALAVNTPGFPLSYVASGQQMSLVASCVPGSLGGEEEEAVTETPLAEFSDADAEVEPVQIENSGDEEARSERFGRLAAMAAADQVARGKRLASMKE